MNSHVIETVHGKVLQVNLTGRLDRFDYKRFVPLSEELIRKHGKIRILVTLEDFHGWDGSALWEDVKWDARHFNDVERIAIVGDKAWEHAMAFVCNAFTSAEVRYFEDPDAAHEWIQVE
jgi:hypothetical protein